MRLGRFILVTAVKTQVLIHIITIYLFIYIHLIDVEALSPTLKECLEDRLQWLKSVNP